jgi:hypothetical protein
MVDEIRAGLADAYPNLHLFIREDGRSEVRGTFPVRDDDGRIIDRYQVAIELLPDFPRSLPIVRETGGRVPWRAEFHVEPDGKACVLLPDDRWRCFPIGAPLRQFLDGPVRDFFLGQATVERGGDWPFGEWSHGSQGIVEYYRELLSTDDRDLVDRFLHVLSKSDLKDHWECPCGSGRRIRRCCADQIRDLRRKIPPAVARQSLEKVCTGAKPYRGPRLRR